MDTGRTGATVGRKKDDPLGSRGNTPAGGARPKPRKKAKTTTRPTPTPSPRSGPIPTPYLALAPTPISSLSSSTIDQLASNAIYAATASASASANSSSNLVLPSSYLRSTQQKRNKSTSNLRSTTTNLNSNSTLTLDNPNEPESGPSNPLVLNRPSSGPLSGLRQQKYVTSLLSPPTIIPGGTSAIPRIQQISTQPPVNTRRRSGDRERERGVNSRRSQERLREIVIGNSSLTSLGQLGQILESGHLPENTQQQQQRDLEENALIQAQQEAQNAINQRRRRRIVRGDGTTGPVRRLTVSSREEGRALGLARGASMRRTNVWDDIPESGEPPPPFPFPTTSTSRLPPAFATPSTNNSTDPNPNSSTTTVVPGGRPRSPPPSFEIAIGLIPSPNPQSTSPDPTSAQTTPRSRPTLSLSTTAPDVPQVNIDTPGDSPSSTHYASAPSSPTHTILGFEDYRTLERERTRKKQERDDRKAWNDDLLAGYTLEERVEREIERRKNRDAPIEGIHGEVEETESEGSIHEISPIEQSVVVQEEMTVNPQRQEEQQPPVEEASNEVTGSKSAEISSTPIENVSTPVAPVVEPINKGSQETSIRLEADPVMPVVALDTKSTAKEPSSSTDAGGESSPVGMKEVSTPSASSASTAISVTPLQSTSRPSPESSAGPSTRSSSQPVAYDKKPSSPAQEVPISKSAEADVPKNIEVVPPKPALATTSPPLASTSAVEEKSTPLPASANDVKAMETSKRKKPIRSSTAEPELPPQSALSPGIKRLSVPEFSPFRPQLHRPTASLSGPLFSKQNQASSPKLEETNQLGDTFGPTPKNDESPTLAEKQPIATKEEILPPSREAAMKRRNLEIKRQLTIQKQNAEPLTLSKPKIKVKIIEEKPVSGPLINFDTPEPSPPNSTLSPSQQRQGIARTISSDISTLAASSAELLSLLELQNELLDKDEIDIKNEFEEMEPVAESSAQGAARMARKPTYPPPPVRKVVGEGLRRVPPPLPKDGPVDKIPDIPSKSNEKAPGKATVESPTGADNGIQPTLPPRRAAPAPPVPRLNLIPKQPPPLPPRPSHVRAQSSASSVTQSISSNSTIKASPPPRPNVTPRLSLIGRTPSLNQGKPKGPRPPPPPPRARQTNWFKNFSPFNNNSNNSSRPAPEISWPTERPEVVNEEPTLPVRPVNERAQTDFPHLVSPAQEEEEKEEKERVIERSSSAMNLNSTDDSSKPVRSESPSPTRIEEQAVLPLSFVGQSAGQTEPDNEEVVERREWTDLDLLVSSIDRLPQQDPYEGFNRISEFLGPSKSNAASINALNNSLLVGLISVDSRRVTTQGKVKLKLSLFGLRVIKCGICLSQFKQNEKAIMLSKCSHSGHESCARRWFREKDSCWVCREVLAED